MIHLYVKPDEASDSNVLEWKNEDFKHDSLRAVEKEIVSFQQKSDSGKDEVYLAVYDMRKLV